MIVRPIVTVATRRMIILHLEHFVYLLVIYIIYTFYSQYYLLIILRFIYSSTIIFNKAFQ